MMTSENVAMSTQEERLDGSTDRPRGDFSIASNKLINGNLDLDTSVANLIHGGVHAEDACPNESDDQLARIVMELTLQNDYLKGQLKGMKPAVVGSFELGNQGSFDLSKPESQNKDAKSSETIGDLQEKIKSLNKEIQQHRETQKAAEDALEHLRAENSEADGKVQELSLKLIEAQQRLEREIKERDDKYVELDSKFGRLHKRAKQRIQELQKEKDDLEARLNDTSIKTEQLSSQQLTAQQEVERTRHQANEALRSMDAERQQLRATNNKLRDNVDELLLSLEGKESALETLQQSLLEKEKALGEAQRSLQTLEDKFQLSITDLSVKHQKQVESLEAQLGDALNERNKATDTISSLQILLAEKDSKIAEMEAASSGEVARLGAALEETKGELIYLKDKHEKEKTELEAGIHALRAKLEASESTLLRSQIEAAKIRSQLEFELSMQKQLLNARDAELVTAKDEINHLEKEFSAYKVRAHAILQKKDAELLAAKNSDLLKEHAKTIEETKRELAAALQKRDDAIKELDDASCYHNKEISVRDAALKNAESQIRTITSKLNSAAANHQEERESWQKRLADVEESWKIRFNKLELEKSAHLGNDVLKELEDIRLQYDKLKVEHETLRDIAERTIEKKDEENEKLVEENKILRQSLEASRVVDASSSPNSDSVKHEAHMSSIAAAEQQILLLARQQAQREEELAHSQRHILALQEEIEELERENRLHNQQEAMLKEELRNMERSKKREGVDMTYLKNVILKLLETGEVEALLPVIGMLLQFSPEEIRKCQQAYRSNDASSQAASVDSTPRSLFSRFAFS